MAPNIGWEEIHGEPIGDYKDFSKLSEAKTTLELKAIVPMPSHWIPGPLMRETRLSQTQPQMLKRRKSLKQSNSRSTKRTQSLK